METLVESIRAAVAPDATDAARTVGAAACRTILAALDARAGEPHVVPASSIEAAVKLLVAVPPDQLIDLAIARLRAALPKL